MQVMAQYSFVRRSPWFVTPGAPPNAQLSMFMLNLRYLLPGSAPKIE